MTNSTMTTNLVENHEALSDRFKLLCEAVDHDECWVANILMPRPTNVFPLNNSFDTMQQRASIP